MEQTQAYVVNSLELHLFFDRIIKEHAYFLNVGFLPPSADFAHESEELLKRFEGLLSRAIRLSDRTVRCNVLESGEICTEFTGQAEAQTQRLTGTAINRQLTVQVGQLRGISCDRELQINRTLMQQVRMLNRDTISQLSRLISFKERVLCSVNECKTFTANYPLLIEHILREARLYRAHLMKLEGRDTRSCQELRNSEQFWNQIMMEHALFIRSLLDPSEDKLIQTAGDFACDYKRLLDTSVAANDRAMCENGTLTLTERFRDFKKSGLEGISCCKIRSLILPLLADHVLREANHYIRLMEA